MFGTNNSQNLVSWKNSLLRLNSINHENFRPQKFGAIYLQSNFLHYFDSHTLSKIDDFYWFNCQLIIQESHISNETTAWLRIQYWLKMHCFIRKVMCDWIWENGHSSHIQFEEFKIYKNHREWYKGLKFSGMIQEWWFYNTWKFHIYLSFLLDFMTHQS